MAQVINTNIASLNAQRNLVNSQTSVNTALQRLSTGLRINSAKDDAAGLAISERMSTQINGLNQAVRNANDGISLAQTAEGALSQIGTNLQRIRELAVQSRNATNSDEDRTALQKEVSQLIAEISRVAKDTEFNGTKLIDGSFTQQAFQVGANQGQTISISSIANASVSKLGQWTSVATSADISGAAPTGTVNTVTTYSTAAIEAGTLTITDGTNSVDLAIPAQTSTVDADAAYQSLQTAINAQLDAAFGNGNVVATVANDGTISFDNDTGAAITIGGDGTLAAAGTVADGASSAAGTGAVATTSSAVTTTSFAALTGGNLTINGEEIEVAATTTAANRLNALVSAINAKTEVTSVTASVIDGKLNLRSSTGDITIGSDLAAADLAEATGLTAGTSATLTGATAYAAGSAQEGFASLNISTVEGADNAILAMDAALKAVNESRADLGAIQNRFSSVVSSLQTTAENLSASRSRILDADFAAETAALTRAQILQQAGTAMLAQANSLPNNVLTLLRG